MIKKLMLLVFFAFNFIGNSQGKKELLSLTFENKNRLEVLTLLDKKSEFSFFYIAKWFSEDTISGEFDSKPITEILDYIFESTNLNYFIMRNKRVILTQNRVIYGDLPENFFGRKNVNIQNANTIAGNVNSPVFQSKKKSLKNTKIKTVRIGKENKIDSRAIFKLNGYAKELISGKPLSDVNIFVKNSKQGVVTDASGYFELELSKGLNVIEASSLGLERLQKNVIIFNDGALNFLLDEDIEELDEVIVEGDQDNNVVESEMGTNSVDAEESKNVPLVMGERNILKVATTLPGVTTAGEGSAGFNVRGGKTDQNLILLDDAVIYNPSHFFGIFQALNPFTTKNIKIYKGSVPAKFGGRLSSVFDITSKDANTSEFKGEASIGPVTNNLALEIPLKKDKTSIMFGGRSSYSDWILKSLDEKSLENSKANFYDLVTKFNSKIDSTNEIKATAYYSKDNFSITSDSVYKYNNALFSIAWDKKINEKNIGRLSLTSSSYGFNIDYDGESNNDFGFDYSIDEVGFNLNMNYLHSNDHKISYGISSKKYFVNPGNIHPVGLESEIVPFNSPKEKGLESAIYLSDNFEVNDKFLINLGLRYSMFQALGGASPRVYEEGLPKNDDTVIETLNFNNNETIKNYGGLETRLSTRYLINNELSIKAGYNSMYQYIHTLSNNTTLSPIDTWKLSDYNIKPQQSQQVALGLFKNIDGNNYEISVEGYYKKLMDVPDFKTGAQLLLNENIETEILQGDGKAYGLELLLRKNKGKLSGWLGYTYSRSLIKFDSDFEEENVNEGRYFSSNYDKPHNLSIVSNFKVTRRFSFSANFEYQTGRPVTYPIGNYNYLGSTYAIYSDRNKFRIPDYYRLDLSFNVEGNHKLKKPGHGYWNISIYNLLGRNNPYSVFFVTQDGDIKAYKSSIFSVPIPTVSYNIKF